METSEQSAAREAAGSAPTTYSVVVPIFNERDSIEELYARIVAVMTREARPFEIVFVSDGSRDGSDELLEQIAQADARVVYLRLRRNFGQATALQAGFDHAGGDVFICMDGDLQHDPDEIPLFLAKIDEGFDIVSGWRVSRSDHLISRRLPSRVANWLLAKASGVALHDFGTTFKAYRREVLQDVRIYGDMHRFIPVICARLGATIAEVPISNVPRAFGTSNYGIGRTFRVAMDILTMRFMTAYVTRPLHFFGKWGLVGGVAGISILLGLFLLKIFSGVPMEQHGPLMELGSLLSVMGVMMLATGLLGEFMARIYFDNSGARTYAIRTAIRSGRRLPPPARLPIKPGWGDESGHA
ncbi:MAG: glycosyltransferase family 2 protein [Rubrivivax sp.]|nr:glycosyltransferase family 2 protein [Rubrivivax sp.]HRY89559.1 glycosyltransferase family 2 protein [Rubrivivax sp.]